MHVQNKRLIHWGMKKSILFVCVVLFFVPYILFSKSTNEKLAQSSPLACEPTIRIAAIDEALPLEQYIKGVVAAEMPIQFEMEALKAQAIAARTYALKSTNFGETPIEATTNHQVFQTVALRKEKWKSDEAIKTNEKRLEQAISETAGQVLYFEDELITAMFHASSNGQTESAKKYSGADLAYLKSVASPENKVTVQTFTLNELSDLLGRSISLRDLLEVRLIKNDTGRVKEVLLGGQAWTGRQFREKLGLRGTDFTIRVAGQDVHFTVSGYGHGVGMSQEGANALAKQGIQAAEILSHYYAGTKIAPFVCPK